MNEVRLSLIMPQLKSIRLLVKLTLLSIIVLVLLTFLAITLTFNRYSQNLVQLKDVSLICDDDICLLIIELVPVRNVSLILINYSLNLPIDNRTCFPCEGINLNLVVKYSEPLRIACLGGLLKSHNDTLAGKIVIHTNQSIEEHIFTVKPRRIGCIGCPH